MIFDIDEKQAKRERRERIAAMCLQGFIARTGMREGNDFFISWSVACADALIAELDKEQSQ